ncbi:DUF1801 domain-containing protein [Enterovibrio sp. ZSDZ35]|uniref:DUF1801 domain-containing protein n=1 Tax=Enterovibrio qingdaonensis TaxID=2899818 RepID=A0ABT5QGJ4_9GAMM|nr:DUF1801 domain-containing protein [Enterovibrio sp. ZSDZ35]MDD1779823.1 DUF1801 domain-containing protein [Enterovibrio sp. ZSDZ35]
MDRTVEEKFMSYPEGIREQLLLVRKQIYAVAEKLDKNVEESLKWGQPSYVVKGGTAIRIDWAESHPDHISLLFNCQTQLIETFREVMPKAFIYEGNRSALLRINEVLSNESVQKCIAVAFTYKARKKLFLLGL